MIVVSNAGPLIALARIRRLDLLLDVYREVRVPTSVWHEIVDMKHDLRPGTAELDAAKWIRKIAIKDAIGAEILRERLDVGESETIVLAIEVKADILLMDEERGRRIAAARGLNVIGTLGTLVLAKQRKLIGTVAPLLDELVMSGFRMSSDLHRAVLAMAGERPPV